MVSQSKIFFILLFINLSTWSQSKLPLFITKQDVRNIRFISNNGNITYYQRSNGSLQLATNYKVQQVLDFRDYTQFTVHVSPRKKIVIIEVDESFHQHGSLRKENTLYQVDYGDFKAKKLAQGYFISHHGLYDEWVSIYHPSGKKITLLNTVNTQLKHEFSILSKGNPYFVPQVVLVNKEQLLYTDIDSSGRYAIRSYNLLSKKKETFIKMTEAHQKIELCHSDERLFIWESYFNNQQQGTRITSIDYKKFSLNNRKFHYQSPQNDLGSLKCHLDPNKIYFIKTTKNEQGKYSFNAAEHDLKKEKTRIISDINFATSLVTMDGKLILPYQGKFYTLLGKNNMTQFDLLKKKSEETP